MSEQPPFPMPVTAIKGAVCLFCYEEAPKLNRCSGCKRAFYCSGECQKKDWRKGHKKLCPALQLINAEDYPKEPQTWAEYRSEMWSRISLFRSQNSGFNTNDERLLQYQPFCTSCHRSSFQLPTSTTGLTLCRECHLVHHCSSCPLETPSHTSTICASLKEVAMAEYFIIAHHQETNTTSVQFPTAQPRTTYIPLSTANSWMDYYTKISDKQMIKGLLTPNLEPLSENQEMASAMRANTKKMSMMLTILAGLEAVFPGDQLTKKDKIILHLVGANTNELEALMLFEEILHLLPSLQEIHCVFVGPELPAPMMGSDNRVVLDTCPSCTAQLRVRSVELHKSAYHDFVISSSCTSVPDLAISFQTGHSQEDIYSWLPSIAYLVNEASHPTLFTTYNEKELAEEIEGLKKMDAKFLVEGEKNKWRSMRPLLEVMEETENSVYFNHQYWYIVDGRKRQSGSLHK